ncbi:uncharacterized protein LOC123537655 [Mercenaria mercenaria]|uniref:uncharacterized protein LOC123537655 n=1 Tax=Mercenaria mercenaria TaxID=6596 RepID=UPI00234F0B17|nr:uncharacterized protein LOC123537655 [Mercenaria mercenaria]
MYLRFKISICLIVPVIVNSVNITSLGSFKVSNAAFVTLYENPNGADPKNKYDFVVSAFSAIPFATDTVQLVKGVGQYMSSVSGIKPEILTTQATWPNEAAGVPDAVFGKRMVIVPYGFILPFKTNGGLKLIDVSSDTPAGPYTITDDSTGQWFYHRVRWHDMDGDGDLDAVTCHAREPIFGSKASELLWLENPNGDVTFPWKTHVLGEGPDIFFEYTTLNSTDGPLNCIVVAQFFTKALSVYWTTDSKGLWSNTSAVKSRVIDATIGAVFEVKLDDVNNDGKVDLLVTNNGNNGSVFVYEIPDDFRTGQFIRHVIGTGYMPISTGNGKGAPGSSFTARVSNDTKPVIILSGDDNGSAYILTAKSQDKTNWDYTQTTVVTTGGETVGQLACADVDGDGKLELFVPSYSTSVVYVYRLDM